SLTDSDTYWSKRAENFEWFKKWDKIQSGNFTDLNVKWFEGGKTNITVNALDRHAKATPDKIAIHWEPNSPSEDTQSFTYQELLNKVCQFANVLKDQGVKKGDRVIFYMPMVPELLAGVLATARIGAVHSVVFGGFSAKALADRINNCGATIVVTADEAYRGTKIVPLKTITDEAIEMATGVKTVLCLEHTVGKVNMVKGRDLWLDELIEKANTTCPPEQMDSEDPLFILYTSGSTGQPKGLQHSTAGYMMWASETYKNVFQANPDDIFWCSADIGWVTGHSYIAYGPLLNGSTQVMFEGVPTWPDAGRFWQVIDKYKVTHFYTAPTAIRALAACDEKFVTDADLSSLKVLGSVGEPINIEAWNWYNEKIGKMKCPIVDTWWQTETGGIMISSIAGVTDDIPCHATLPLPGVELMLVDKDGKEISGNPAEGNLCVKRPWPGVARTVFGDHERYKSVYFSDYPGYYFTGDGARRDENGNYRITGRVDDVINVSGHRIGTAEVEDAINEHEAIAESAVIGFPHDIKGEALMAFMIPFNPDNHDDLLADINQHITKHIGPIAKLERAIIVPGLPKTRSGKIMRRILRKISVNDLDNLGDTSTLLNPEIVDEIIKAMK
ncbi:MAG: acetate--CoA ligase, partial [Flavobacteriaceae bacterium]|nr:acetate--CoA ligase [Flavobacteriaceae bacterium]